MKNRLGHPFLLITLTEREILGTGQQEIEKWKM